MNQPVMAQVTVRLPVELVHALDRHAEDLLSSRGEIVREALSVYRLFLDAGLVAVPDTRRALGRAVREVTTGELGTPRVSPERRAKRASPGGTGGRQRVTPREDGPGGTIDQE